MSYINKNSKSQKILIALLGTGTLGLAGLYFYRKSIESKTYQYQIQKLSNEMIRQKNKNIQKQLQALNKIIKDNFIKKISTIPQFQEMKNSICSRQLQVNENYYVCLECSKTFDDNQLKNLSEDDKKDKKNVNFYNHMAMCEPCYKKCNDKHQGHYVEQRKVKAYAHNMVCCDCGDQNFLKKEGFCEDHCGFDENQILTKISQIDKQDYQFLMDFLMHLFYIILQHSEETKFNEAHQSTAISLIKNIITLFQDLQNESVVFRYFLGDFLVKRWSDFDPKYIKSSWKFTHKCSNLDTDNLQQDLNLKIKQNINNCTCNFFEVFIQYTFLQSLEIHELFYKISKDISTINSKFNTEITFSLSKKINQCLFAKKLFLQNENKNVIFMDLAEIYDILAFLIDDKQREEKVISIGEDFINHLKTFTYLLQLYLSKGLYQLTYKSLFEVMQVFFYSLRNPNISKHIVQYQGLFKQIFSALFCFDKFIIVDKLQNHNHFLAFMDSFMPAVVITKEMHYQINSHIQTFLINLSQQENKEQIFTQIAEAWRNQIEKVEIVNKNCDPKCYDFSFTMTLPLMVTYLPQMLSQEVPNKKKITQIFEKYLINLKYSDNKDAFIEQIKKFLLLFRQQLKTINLGFMLRSVIKAQQEQGLNSELYNGYMKLEYKTTNSLFDEENFGYQILCLYEKDTQFLRQKYFQPLEKAYNEFHSKEKLSPQEDEFVQILNSAVQDMISFVTNDSFLFNCFGTEQSKKLPNVDKEYLALQEQFIRKTIINILQIGKYQYNDLVEQANWYLSKSFQINHIIEEVAQIDPVTKFYSLKKEYENNIYPQYVKQQYKSIKKQVKELDDKYDEQLGDKKTDAEFLINDENYPFNKRQSNKELPTFTFYRELWQSVFLNEYLLDLMVQKLFLNLYDKCNIDTKKVIILTLYKIVQLLSISINDPFVENNQEDINLFNKLLVNNNKLLEKLDEVLIELEEQKLVCWQICVKRTKQILEDFLIIRKQRNNSEQID